MSNVLLAAIGFGVTLTAFAGFSVYQLEKTAAEARGPQRSPAGADEPSSGGSEPTPRAA